MKPKSQEIRHFNSGVSQQPPALRSPEQLEEQLNCMSSEAEGLIKRPPTIHQRLLTDLKLANDKAIVHIINRDVIEQYIVIIDGESVQVFDINGNKRNVTIEGAALSYIKTLTPRKDIHLITVADHTFVLNKNKVVKMSNKKSPNIWASQGLLVRVKQGHYGRTYTVQINGNDVASYTTPDGSEGSHSTAITTDSIVNELANRASGKGWNIHKGSSWLYLYANETSSSTQTQVQIGPKISISDIAALFPNYKYMGMEDKAHVFAYGALSPDANRIERAREKFKICEDNNWAVTDKQQGIVHYIYVTPTYKTETITVENTSSPIKSFKVYDGFDGSAALGIHTTVPKFSDLPRTAPDGFTVLVQGEIQSDNDDYYVSFDTTQNLWIETCRPNIKVAIDSKTMPHILVSNADGSFTFKPATWDERQVGDENSNPLPSFVGRAIGDIFFFRNRFGILSGENCLLSESSSFFNFWMSTATNVLDTDTIDIPVSHTSVVNLRHAVLFNEVVMLVADNVQFMLKADGILTPKSVTAPMVTEYPCGIASPVTAGKRMYYAAKRSEYTTIREFYAVGTIDDAKLTNDISAHIPHYIPDGVYSILPNNTENLIMVLTEGKASSVYIYKYLFSEEQRLQSSWSEWNFGDTALLLGGGCVDNTFYFVIKRDGNYCLEYINLALNSYDLEGEPYRIYADRKVSYLLNENQKVIDIADIYKLDRNNIPSKEWCIVTPDEKYIKVTKDDLINGVYRPMTHLPEQVFVGEIFPCRITLSTIMVMTEQGRLTAGRLQLRYITFNYANSGLFDVIVKTAGNEANYRMSGKYIGNSKVGKLEWLTGNFRVPLQSHNVNCSITVESDNPVPFNIISAVWEGIFYMRSQRI